MAPAEIDRRTRPAAAVPASLEAKMRASRSAGERKPVTILFADIVGSTALVEKMDPEDWTVMVNEAFDRMSRTIYRYEGTIARLMGDAVLAFFGAPVAHEDDPERAVRCALDMIASIREYAAELRRGFDIEFEIRAGINTGPVVVSNVGSDLKYEYTAMGDAVNVASRMQNAARPSTVLVTGATYRFIAPLFDAQSVGPLTLKGKSEPIEAYEIAGPKALPGRVRGVAGLESPMVGREQMLARLRDLLAVAKAGSGRVACILGEPGIGKSRLLAEFRSAAAADGVAWAEGHCVSYGQSLPYHLLLDVLRNVIGVSAAEREPAVREALRATCERVLGDAWADAYAYLGHLLGIRLEPEHRAKVEGITPDTLRSRYVVSLIQLLRAMTKERPLVLVCEDIHWADPASVDLLSLILPMVHELALLEAATSRVERAAPGWRLVTGAEQVFGESLAELRLAPLDEQQSRALVANLLEIESLPERVRAFVLERAEGNPLFVEELVRMLIDRGAIERQGDRWVATKEIETIEIPANLQGLLLGRIDRLPDDAKRVLRVASVIGRRFALPVLEQVAGNDPAELRRALGTLEAAGLVELSAAGTELEYSFRHVLIHEAAYDSLLRQERRGLHARAAEVLERRYPHRRVELAGVFAIHLEQAGETARSAPLFLEAADHAAARNASYEARAFYDKVLAFVPADTTDPAALRMRVRAGVGRVKVGWSFAKWDEDIGKLETTIAEAERLGDPKLTSDAHYWSGFLRQSSGQRPDMSPQLARSQKRLMELGAQGADPLARASALALAGMGATLTGDVRVGSAMLEQALPQLRASADVIRTSMAAGVLAVAYARQGLFARAAELADEAEGLAAAADPLAQMDAQLIRSTVELERGDLVRAVEIATTCARRGEDIGSPSCVAGANLVLAATALARGEAENARRSLDRTMEIARVGNNPFQLSVARGMNSAATALLGDLPTALEGFEESIAFARRIGNRSGEALLLRLRGLARAGSGELDGAIADLAASAAGYEALGVKTQLARSLRDHGVVLRLAGKRAEGEADVARAGALFDEMGIAREPSPMETVIA